MTLLDATPLTTYRGVSLLATHPLPGEVAIKGISALSSLIGYAKLDGVSLAGRKALTRIKGRGQFAPYRSVHFSASERIGADGELQRGRWEGRAIGQVLQRGTVVELLTWNQDLSRSDLHEIAPPHRYRPARRGIAVIGCGAFSENIVLPALTRANAYIAGVADSSLLRAQTFARRARGAVVYATPSDLLESAQEFEGIVIACAHSAHSNYAARALAFGVPTLLEKPAAVDERGLRNLLATVLSGTGKLRVGHNRRFARYYDTLRQLSLRGPVDIQADVEAYPISEQHWYRAPSEGGRVLGNLTHWLDLAIGICQDVDPVGIRCTPLHGDGVQVEVRFPDSSKASLRLHDVGRRVVAGRETVVVRALSASARVDDWSTLRVEGGRKIVSLRNRRDRGHMREYSHWFKEISLEHDGADPLEPVRAHLCAFIALAQLDSDDSLWRTPPNANEWARS